MVDRVLYSFVVPIYNDGALARDFCVEMAKVFRAYLGHDDLARDLRGHLCRRRQSQRFLTASDRFVTSSHLQRR